jgi:hypothetical protein
MANEHNLPKQIEILDRLLESGKQIDQTTLEIIKRENPDLYDLLIQSNMLRSPKLVKPNPLYVASSKTRIFHEVVKSKKERVSPLNQIAGLFTNFNIPKLSFSPALTVLLVLVLCFSLFVGGASAADSAGPGDFLYPVDQAIESARLILTVNDHARLQLLLSFANERLEEADKSFSAEDSENAEIALAGYEREMESINALLENEEFKFSDDLLHQADQTIKNNTTVLENLLGSGKIPFTAQDAINHAIDVSKKHLGTEQPSAAESTKTPPGLEDKETPPGLQEDQSPPGQEDKQQKTPPGQEKPKKTPPGLENKDKNTN